MGCWARSKSRNPSIEESNSYSACSRRSIAWSAVDWVVAGGTRSWRSSGRGLVCVCGLLDMEVVPDDDVALMLRLLIVHVDVLVLVL